MRTSIIMLRRSCFTCTKPSRNPREVGVPVFISFVLLICLVVAVVKEPPYSVKESGYAGFQMLIDIYLKNKYDPKKIGFTYELDLPNSGPRISRVQKEKYIFQNPSEEFRYKLLKGGGIVSRNKKQLLVCLLTNDLQLVSSSGNQDNLISRPGGDEKASQVMGKPKLTGGDVLKKHKTKVEEPRISDSFQELFGTPITKTSKISPDPQKMVEKTKKDVQQQKSDKGKNFLISLVQSCPHLIKIKKLKTPFGKKVLSSTLIRLSKI